MKKQFDVLALGELLIDFTENGASEQGNPLLEANPGGAPCNVLAMLQKLDKSTAFIGKVGKDMFGLQLRQAAEQAGICMDYLLEDEFVHTTLAFVKTFPNGDRDFSFYREPGADMMLKADELPLEALGSGNGKLYELARSLTSRISNGIREEAKGRCDGLLTGIALGFALATVLSAFM